MKNSVQEEKIIALKEQVEKLQSQKNKLLRELDTVEEQYEKMDGLYRKYIPMIIGSVSEDNGSFAKVCKELSIALKKGKSPSKIEYIFEQLKSAIFKEDISPGFGKKKKGIFSSFLKNASDPFIDEYKQSYHGVINTLRSNIDQKYFSKLDNIVKNINSAENVNDISEIREKVFNLVFVYISDTNQDRGKLNAFVQEIVGKIFDIESKLTATYTQTDTIFQSNQEFESVLNSELTELKQATDVASSLDILKVKVAERLAYIENALDKKQSRDKNIKGVVKKSRQDFNTEFVKLKQRLDKATHYSEELERKLNLDQLTGAYNRRAYDNRIEEEMERFLRYGRSFSLLLIDADKFKLINDNYGHSIGDRCLKEIINRTIPLLRKNDMLARYGGEEFVVIMPETDDNGARTAAEKIRQTIEKIEFIYKKDKVKVTVSIGVSQSKEGDKNHQQVFDRADIAVYKAKEGGRNRVVVN